jgi:hypothetical protein
METGVCTPTKVPDVIGYERFFDCGGRYIAEG